MIGSSGCFVGPQTAGNIDSVEDVSAAVNDIIAADLNQDNDGNQAAYLLAYHYTAMDKRVRLLTYAVIALAVVVIMKEL